MQQEVILETPFLQLIKPSRVLEEGIQTMYRRQEILFEFISKPIYKDLNIVNLIQHKKEHIKQIKT